MRTDIKSVKVWDVFVRIFHWTLVASIVVQYLTGDEVERVHTIFGYFIICLVSARILWGFIGTKHARFNDFLYRPGKIYRYLKRLVNGNPIHYEGHNPAGGLMVIVMLLSLSVTTFTGLKALGSEGKGPLAKNAISMVRLAYADEDEDDDNAQTDKAGGHQKNQKEEFWEEIHEAMTGFMIFLIVVHLAGVIVSSWAHKENLILSMITGKKKTA